MYVRTARRKNKNGSVVEYYQLAESYYNKEKKRSETRILLNLGRADRVDKASLRRLAHSILRICEGDEPSQALAIAEGIELLDSFRYGTLYVVEQLWEQLGIGGILRNIMAEKGCILPYDRLLMAMVAHRLDAPGSKRECYLRWLKDEVYLPEANSWKLEHLYEAMDFLYEHIGQIEEEIFFSVANLLNLQVDLIFFDTTTFYFEIDKVDDEDCDENERKLAGLRRWGHSKDRADKPQVVVALAVTTEGLPVRSWVFPGNTVDAAIIAKCREELQGWNLGKCILVGDAGMFSAENESRLSRGCGRYILAVPMRKLKEVEKEVLSKRGRYQKINEKLEYKEVIIGDGERRKRYVICRNVVEAERQRSHREKLLEMLEKELQSLRQESGTHPKKACELLASRRFGRYLRQTKTGKLRIDRAKVRQEERFDGKYVVTANDDTLTAADLALGYKSMWIIEGCFRTMKTTGLQTRPMFHWTSKRIEAHIKLCVLALLLQRTAELRCEDSWRNIHHELNQLHAIRYKFNSQIIVQITSLRKAAQAYLEKLNITRPRKILSE